MATLLRMPEPAAGATSATLSQWPLPEGATFTAGSPLAVIETDKATIEVEAEADGVLLRTLVAPGAEVDVGAPIALIGAPGENPGDIDVLLTELGAAPSPTPSTVPPAETSAPARTGTAGPVTADGSGAAGAPVNGGRRRIFISPLARRLAREAGLPIERLSGTGPGGRITRRDVEAALAASTAPAPPAAPQAPAGGRGEAGYRDVPHTRMRRAIARRVTESKQTVPHFYLKGTARAEPLLAAREQLNGEDSPRISVNDLVIKAVARAHLLVPEMNVVWTPDAVRRFSRVDVAVAVATDSGLVTPVLRGVDTMPIATVAETVRRHAAAAREGRLRQEDLDGGVITVTNLGMYGVEEFGAIINPPHSAILAVGAITSEPVITNDTVAPGKVIRFVLSADHRPIDGVLAARWMRELINLIENPIRIFA